MSRVFPVTPVRYRWVVDPGEDDDTRRRVRVVRWGRWEGYIVRWTEACSGCLEMGDYGQVYYGGGWDPKLGMTIGAGCEECGYTGKRRRTHFVAFDQTAYDRYLEERYVRWCRFDQYLRRRSEARG